MSRLLSDLDPRAYPTFCEFLALLVEARIPVLIADTLRTPTEQQAAQMSGRSWTANSRHLPQPPHDKAWAIDVVPYAQYLLHGIDKLQWDEKDPTWAKVGAIGESLGLKWGVVMNGKHFDLGHFEWAPDGRRLPTARERLDLLEA